MAVTYKTAISQILDEQKCSEARLARMMGTFTQTVFKILHVQKSANTESLIRMADCLGYDLVLTRKGEKLPASAFILKGGEE